VNEVVQEALELQDARLLQLALHIDELIAVVSEMPKLFVYLCIPPLAAEAQARSKYGAFTTYHFLFCSCNSVSQRQSAT
jgi:hypothetical protein